MTIDIEELRRLHEATTQGEWSTISSMPHRSITVRTEGGKKIRAIGCIYAAKRTPSGFSQYTDEDIANAEFIATTHEVLPTLLDEIERLREEVPRAWSCAEACADARRELEREIERLRAEVEFRKARCNELMGRGDE